MKSVSSSVNPRGMRLPVNHGLFKQTTLSSRRDAPKASIWRLFREASRACAAFVGAFCFYAVGTGDAVAQTSACGANEVLTNFSFPAGTWADGTLEQNYTVGTAPNQVTLSFTVSGINQIANTPRQAQRGSVNNSLSIEMDRPNITSGGLTVLLGWSRPVNKLPYLLLDVDSSNGTQNVGSYQDRMLVTGLNQAAASDPSMIANTPGRHTLNPFSPPNEAIAISGPNSCAVSTTTNTSDTATCTRAAGLAGGTNSVFTLPVSVAANASGTLTNRAKVFGGGDANKPAETTTGTIASGSQGHAQLATTDQREQS